uniref:GPR180/TMEM145 transmembrane domain-containing protein n=1 Tax=Aceria tosichella TaxID=561515 RepID=A0A6G1SB22_9ACAR
MMNIQNYLLCILYLILIVIHSITLCHKEFHRGLISVFTFALFAETVSTVLEALHQLVLNHGRELQELTQFDPKSFTNLHYIAQLIHITSINFFILFLLIVAKGWPITRRDMPFKYAFALFWSLCLSADLITFYWTTITAIASNFTVSNFNNNNNNSSTTNFSMTTSTSTMEDSISTLSTTTIATTLILDSHPTTTSNPLANLSSTIMENLPKDQEQFNTTPKRLSLVLRVVIMLFFLMELRTTMNLEQEKRKLQFYLHFGALTMVWFVHTVIVYIISLRVDSNWQSKLISGFSSAANFLGFAVTTRLLWPKNSNSDLFKKRKEVAPGSASDEVFELDNFSTIDREEDGHTDEDYEGLQMRDLDRKSRT